MRPFEADEYVRGWDARIVDAERSANPWKWTTGAWDRYRERAWDMGWRACDAKAVFIDPRKGVAS